MTTPLDVFGPGQVMVTRVDVVNATPVNIGYSQELMFDFSANIKELYGQNQLPIDAARGTMKITGKLKAAVISSIAWNNVFFGNSFVSGGIRWNPSEAGTIPTTPFQITVVNSATFDQDLGVVYATGATANIPLVKVASAPATGQYSNVAGVYTFAAADTGRAVLITYTNTVTTGQTLNVNNQLLGTAPTFQLDYYTTRAGKALVIRVPQCQANKLSFAAKLEDFMMPDFEFHAFTDATGNAFKIYYPEVA